MVTILISGYLMSVLMGLLYMCLRPHWQQFYHPLHSLLLQLHQDVSGASWRKLELPQLAPLKVEEQHLYSEHPLGTKASHRIRTAAPILLLEELFLIVFDLVIIIILQRGRKPHLQVYFNMFFFRQLVYFVSCWAVLALAGDNVIGSSNSHKT